jgi:hypothetical protein
MDWMGLEKIEKKFDLFGIQTHPIPLNPHGLRANRTSPKRVPPEYDMTSTSLLLSPFGINCHKGGASLTTGWRIHAIIVSAEGVKERGELPKVLLELLLPLTYFLNAVVGR